MEAKLNALKRLDLRALCSKKLLGIPIDYVVDGKRIQFSKKELIKKILEKDDSSIQGAIDKRNKAPSEYAISENASENASDDESVIIKSPVKDLVDKVATRRKQDIATKKGVEAEKSFGKQYFKKFQKAIENKKMTKKELVDFIKGFEESHDALGNEEFTEMRDIAINKYDNEGKVRISDIEGKNRSSLEDETIANLRRIVRQKQGETPKPKPKHVEPKKEDETPKKTGEPPKQKQGDILPKKPDEFEKEKSQQDQFKKITRKNVGKIDLSVKVEDDNVKVKPNVKVSDIKKAIQKNSSRLKLSKPPKIVYHSLKNMGKTALLTI